MEFCEEYKPSRNSFVWSMAGGGKGGNSPPNGPSTTGNPSGGGRGNNPPK